MKLAIIVSFWGVLSIFEGSTDDLAEIPLANWILSPWMEMDKLTWILLVFGVVSLSHHVLQNYALHRATLISFVMRFCICTKNPKVYFFK